MTTTRVWRLLQSDDATPRTHDSVLRLALVSMASDATSPLTPVQRQWIRDLHQRRHRFTPQGLTQLQGPLLAWAIQAMPQCYEILASQFGEGVWAS